MNNLSGRVTSSDHLAYKNSDSLPSQSIEYDWKQAYEDLARSLQEDVNQLNKLIDDPDSCCAARQLRIERRNAFLYVLGLHETLSHWDYS